MVETLAELSALLLQRLEFVLRPFDALTPSLEGFPTAQTVRRALRRHIVTQKTPLALRHNVGKPTPLTLYDRDNNVVLFVVLEILANFEKVTINQTFNTGRGIGETIETTAHLHVDIPL
jgi:hypothetical protein